MQKKSLQTRMITRIALLVSMAVVLKVFVALTWAEYRLSFYDVPLMITGIMFGPFYGLVAGFATDVVNIVYPNYAKGFNLFTVSSMMWGFIPGLFLFKRKYSVLRLTLVVVLTSVVCFSINTVQLAWMSNGASLSWAFLTPRIITLLIKLPIQVIIVDVLFARVLFQDMRKLEKTYEAA